MWLIFLPVPNYFYASDTGFRLCIILFVTQWSVHWIILFTTNTVVSSSCNITFLLIGQYDYIRIYLHVGLDTIYSRTVLQHTGTKLVTSHIWYHWKDNFMQNHCIDITDWKLNKPVNAVERQKLLEQHLSSASGNCRVHLACQKTGYAEDNAWK